MKSLSRARLFVTPWTVAYQAPPSMEFTRLLRPWNFPGKSTGVACHFLLQGIFLTQVSNPGLVHCSQMLYRLSHQASPCTQKTHNICWIRLSHMNSIKSLHLFELNWVYYFLGYSSYFRLFLCSVQLLAFPSSCSLSPVYSKNFASQLNISGS